MIREEYKVTILSHLKNCWTIFVGLGIAFLILWYARTAYGLENTFGYIKLISIIFSFLFIPHIILHLRYYGLSKGTVFYYYPNELKVKIRTGNGEETAFFMDDIDKVKYAKSYPLAENRMQWFPWDNYSYARIYLKNGKQFLITSLVVPNMNLPVEPQKIRLHKTFYAYPSKKEVPYKEKPVKEKPVKEKRKYRNW